MWASTAVAAQIDPELKQILDEKSTSRGEIIPVLMVFPEQPDLEDLEIMLDGATPQKRRKSAIAALKRKARKAQTDAWEILDDPDLPGELAYANMLYFSNAISFGADREVILAVAEVGTTSAPTMRSCSTTRNTNSGRGHPPARCDGLKSARADTAWNVKFVHAHRGLDRTGRHRRGHRHRPYRHRRGPITIPT